jgi:hypothetical protein|tara:strand:- start:199 stop:366 length:168 start_codon:yes stop_codon:yes gene_type:complete
MKKQRTDPGYLKHKEWIDKTNRDINRQVRREFFLIYGIIIAVAAPIVIFALLGLI